MRMGVAAIHALSCRFDLKPGENETIEAHGFLRARLRQSCVVSLEPFECDLMEQFRVRFVPRGQETDDLDIEADDELPYDGGTLELGEAAAEQLALAIDPFPRKPGAEMPGSLGQSEGGAFAALAKLLPPQ
jgi:uncharacterized metal-binding protein YceD (DUF177 family)